EDAPVKWLLAKAIARDEKATSPAVPDCERKHAIQLADHSVAILFVQVRQHFGVGCTAKRVSSLFEIGAKLAIVVDLTVENDGDRPVFIEYRLFTGDEIDDRQPSHSERYAGCSKQPF